MQDNKFWRGVALLFVGGLLYVGHGLHNGNVGGAPAPSMPSLLNAAHAGGVAMHVPSDPTYKSDAACYLYTSSEDGRTVWHWKVDKFGVALWEHETHVGSHNVAYPNKAQRDAKHLLPQPQDPAPSSDTKTPGRGTSGGKGISGVVIPGGNKIPGVAEPPRAKKTSGELTPIKK